MIDQTFTHPIGDDPPTARLLYGVDVLEGLCVLEDHTIHTVCTSPPYFGLRDYGMGGKQIGLEQSVEEYVEKLVSIFSAIKRVLRKDGTLWLNLGDSYAGGGGSSGHDNQTTNMGRPTSSYGSVATGGRVPNGFKPKDLMGVPWRLALALQTDGWYLRNEVIWSKANPMPESCKDRMTRSHEHIFLFAHPDSGGKYYYDQDAIREPLKKTSLDRNKYGWNSAQRTHDPNEKRGVDVRDAVFNEAKGSNKRTVWNVNPSNFKGAHFATWPPALVEPMVKAGCPKGGVVLDPFSGSATTGKVALDSGRNFIGVDLNEGYLEIALSRLNGSKTPKNDVEVPEVTILDIFGSVGGT